MKCVCPQSSPPVLGKQEYDGEFTKYMFSIYID